MPIRVSVIIPCYNTGAFLEEAVRSALAQTWPDVEVIVVDDGSDDAATLAALDTVASYARVSVIRQENRGVSTARNVGFSHSSGGYIMLLDADDTVANGFAEKAVAVMESDPAVGIVCCRARYTGDMNKEVGAWRGNSVEDALLGKIHNTFGMYRREDWIAVGGFDPALSLAEDMDFWLAVIGLGRTIHRLDEVLFLHRQHRDSTLAVLRREGIQARTRAAREYILKKHWQLYIQYPGMLVDKLFPTRVKNPTTIRLRKLKYRLVLVASTLPGLGALLEKRARRARDQLAKLAHM